MVVNSSLYYVLLVIKIIVFSFLNRVRAAEPRENTYWGETVQVSRRHV